jgi:hypothetical protein
MSAMSKCLLPWPRSRAHRGGSACGRYCEHERQVQVPAPQPAGESTSRISSRPSACPRTRPPAFWSSAKGEVCQARSAQLSTGRADAHFECSADLENNESFEPYTRNLFVRRVLPKDVSRALTWSRPAGAEAGPDQSGMGLDAWPGQAPGAGAVGGGARPSGTAPPPLEGGGARPSKRPPPARGRARPRAWAHASCMRIVYYICFSINHFIYYREAGRVRAACVGIMPVPGASGKHCRSMHVCSVSLFVWSRIRCLGLWGGACCRVFCASACPGVGSNCGSLICWGLACGRVFCANARPGVGSRG